MEIQSEWKLFPQDKSLLFVEKRVEDGDNPVQDCLWSILNQHFTVCKNNAFIFIFICLHIHTNTNLYAL